MRERLPSTNPTHETADYAREKLDKFNRELDEHMRDAHHGKFTSSCHACMNIGNAILGWKETLNRITQKSHQ